MIELRTGDFIDAKVITAIRIGKATTKEEREFNKFSHPPRVLVDFNRSNIICIDFKRLKDAKGYAIELHEKVKEELAQMVQSEANAERIVTCVNSHDELLAACKYVVRYHKENDSGEGELFGLDFVTTCIAAISKAEGSAQGEHPRKSDGSYKGDSKKISNLEVENGYLGNLNSELLAALKKCVDVISEDGFPNGTTLAEEDAFTSGEKAINKAEGGK